MAGIYIHIPFCKQACHYCNFFFTTSQRNVDETIIALSKELELRADYLKGHTIESIYFGGGTPSMLSPESIQSIIDKVYQLFSVSDNPEITIETNPDNLTVDYIYKMKTTSVNRFSIGIQSFFEEDLIWMNRAHHAYESEACIKASQDAGFENLTLDFIFGVPISNQTKWQANLEKAIQFHVPHLSCYALTVEAQTALDVHIRKGISKEPLDADIQNQFYQTHDILTANSFEHYEISNYAKPGHRAVHNSNYWNGVPYLGIGPSAHSFNGISRSWNISHMQQYLRSMTEGKAATTTENLTQIDQFNEKIMVSLRRMEGLDMRTLLHDFPNFVTDFEQQLSEVNPEWIEYDNHVLKLSRTGLVFADRVASDLFVVE